MTKSRFRNLDDIQMQNNNITRLNTGSFYFIAKLRSLDLSNNKLDFIEPGAFQGPVLVENMSLKYFSW